MAKTKKGSEPKQQIEICCDVGERFKGTEREI